MRRRCIQPRLASAEAAGGGVSTSSSAAAAGTLWTGSMGVVGTETTAAGAGPAVGMGVGALAGAAAGVAAGAGLCTSGGAPAGSALRFFQKLNIGKGVNTPVESIAKILADGVA
ncbi:hypothetical protein CS8_040670 [Cupriavidus sp. 8B]